MQFILNCIFLKKIYWSIGDVQSCISFRYTAKWISYTCINTYIHSLWFFFHIGHNRVLSRVPCATQHILVIYFIYANAKSLQSCPTLCDPIDCNPLGSSVPGILQARILGWVAISFSNAWKWKVKGKLLSHAWLLATPWTAAHQAPPSMGFSSQEYWSGLPLPSPILYIVVYICQLQSPNLFLPSLFPGNHKFVFYIDSTSVL